MSFLFSQPAPGVLPANSVDFTEVETIAANRLLGNNLGTESTIKELEVSDVATMLNLASLQPLDSDLTAIAGLSPADNDLIQRKSGAWTNRTPAQFKIDLSLTKSDVGLSNVANVDQTNASNISSGTLSISYGGTGQTTANAALNALLPTQGSSANKFLKTDGSNTSWADAGVSTAGALEHQVLVYDGAAVTWAYAGLGDGTFGTGNIILGANKPTSLSGTKNILISSTALNYLTTESNNIIFTNTWVPSSSAGSSNVVIGIDSTANYSGDNVVIGANTSTNGLSSVAIGRSATVWGRGIAIGRSATAQGFTGGDIAIGPYASATGGYGSIAIGDTATSSGNYSTVLGHTATASNFTDVVAIGNAANAGANNHIVIGSGAGSGSGSNVLVIGKGGGRSNLTGGTNIYIGNFTVPSYGTAKTNNIIISHNPGAFTSDFANNSVMIGATCSGNNPSNAVIIGQGATAGPLAIGYNASGPFSVGQSTTSSVNNSAIGNLTSATGSYGGIAIGTGAASTGTASTALGAYSTDGGLSRAFCVGGTDNDYYYSTAYFGKGGLAITSAGSVTAFKIMVSRTSGSNIDATAGTMTLAGSQGTGTGAGGDVILSTAPAGAAGSSLNNHVERLRCKSATEVVVNDTAVDFDFRVEGTSDANLLMVDAGNNRVGIGTATPSEKLEVNGNIKGGTISFNADSNRTGTLTNLGFLTNTKTHDFGSLSHGAEEETTITVTGAAVGDICFVGAPSTVELGLSWDAYVSAADTVTLRIYNYQNSGSIDPASATWRVTVLKS